MLFNQEWVDLLKQEKGYRLKPVTLFFTGAPGMNRRCDIRIRKIQSCYSVKFTYFLSLITQELHKKIPASSYIKKGGDKPGAELVNPDTSYEPFL